MPASSVAKSRAIEFGTGKRNCGGRLEMLRNGAVEKDEKNGGVKKKRCFDLFFGGVAWLAPSVDGHVVVGVRCMAQLREHRRQRLGAHEVS